MLVKLKRKVEGKGKREVKFWWKQTCRISDKDEKLVRDVSPSQGLQSAISQTEEAPERAKRLSPISPLCLIFYKFFLF